MKYWLLFLLLLPSVVAYDVSSVQEVHVNDLADVFSSEEEQQLDQWLQALERNSSLEFAVVTVSTIKDESMEDVSLQIAEHLGLGKADVDNGLLFFIAFEDRKYRIEVGYGLEGAIPDALAGRVGDYIVVPAFRNGDYYQGTQEALAVLAGYAVQDESVISRFEAEQETSWLGWFILIIVLCFIVFSFCRGIFFIGFGGFNGGFSGGSGGFSGGFGGGGFGGGGAGGGW